VARQINVARGRVAALKSGMVDYGRRWVSLFRLEPEG
jgi:hypothetical protein